MEKLLWDSWELKTDVVPNAVHKGKLSFRILEDYEHLLADRYLNSWRCTESCVLGVLFLPSSLIFRYILVTRVGGMISAGINTVMRKFRGLPSAGEEGTFVKSSICDADVAVGGWLEELFFWRIGALVLENLHFLPVATSVRDGAP